ncbi:MAG: hypothetical protein QM737_07800 [Ferruginibacter sp.]
MRAQDYLSFSDTAKPITNYIVKESESVSWSFYRKSDPYDKFIDSLKQLPDTILDGNKFKRLYFDISGEDWHQRITYFLFNAPFRSIFHMAKAIDSLYPGYIVKYIEYRDLDKGSSAFAKLFLVRDNLTLPETKIFKQWESNLKTSVLPVTTLSDAQKKMAAFWQ